MKRKSAHAYAELLLAAASQARASEQALLVKRFIELLRSHRAMRLLPSIVRSVEHLSQEKEGISHATIHLADAQISADKLAHAALGKSTTTDIIEDSTLIGGAVVRVGDTQVDRSIRATLISLKHQLQG